MSYGATLLNIRVSRNPNDLLVNGLCEGLAVYELEKEGEEELCWFVSSRGRKQG